MFFAKKNKNNPNPYLDFVEAAEWADRTMIDKACEWLKKWTYQDCLGVSPITRLKVGFSSVEELIEDFCKSMEE